MTSLLHAGKLAGHLPGLLLEAEKVAQSFMRGAHGRRRTGMGDAFWQFRPWQQGDTTRDIDWRQTAKRDQVFVRETEWEASQTVWMYRDASESMNFFGKKYYAEVMMLALGIVLLSGGEQVGLMGTGLAPQTSYAAIQRLHDAMPAQTHMTEGPRPISAQSQVVLISDFYFPLAELTVFCEQLAARNVKGVLAQVFDPSEKTLPGGGRVKFQDTESGGMLDIAKVDAVRAEYEARFAAHRDGIAALALDIGWAFHPFATDVKQEEALTALYEDLAVK